MGTVRASTPSDIQTSANQRRIPLSEPWLCGNEWTYLKECLDTGWVSSAGPFVERFEQKVAEYVGTPHAVATVNGTAALHIALKVVGVREDDEVLVPTLTFIAPVNAIRYCGAHPVFVDADPASWQVDVKKVKCFLEQECELRPVVSGPVASAEECWNKRTGRRVRAILPVHILGLACDMKAIGEIAQQYHLWVVEDAAEGMGVRYRGQHVGWWGDVGCLSFNGNKIMTSGSGGMLVTDNAGYADYARYLTTQAKDDELEYVHNEVGYNYRLTNLQAAVGLAQLEQLDQFVAKKRAIVRVYEDALREFEGLMLMPTPLHTEPTYWLYTILLSGQTTLAMRQAFIRNLHAQGIGARPLWHPIHSLPPYRQCQAVSIEHAVRLYERGVSLPCSVGVSQDDLQRCIEVVKGTLERNALFR